MTVPTPLFTLSSPFLFSPYPLHFNPSPPLPFFLSLSFPSPFLLFLLITLLFLYFLWSPAGGFLFSVFFFFFPTVLCSFLFNWTFISFIWFSVNVSLYFCDDFHSFFVFFNLILLIIICVYLHYWFFNLSIFILWHLFSPPLFFSFFPLFPFLVFLLSFPLFFLLSFFLPFIFRVFFLFFCVYFPFFHILSLLLPWS